MSDHPLHKLTLDDGSLVLVFQPPDWLTMTYRFEPVALSSIFEAYDGTARKQINAGSTAKRRLTVRGTSWCALPISQLLDDRTWDVTIIDPHKLDQQITLTMWIEGSADVPQDIDAKEALRSWVMEFREA